MAAPLDTARLRRIGGGLGSNPAGIFQDEAGRCYYIKSLDSPAYARNERLAAALYQLAGAPSLCYVATCQPHEVATEWLHLDKKSLAQLSPEECRQARRWFGVHAWTANWDAVGLHGDNQGLAQGVVLTLDLGGALEFRAQGDPKGKAFGPQVPELHSLRTSPDNPQATRLFGGMSSEELQTAIRQVTQLPDDAIRNTILQHGGSAKLADKMLARKAHMAEFLAGLG